MITPGTKIVTISIDLGIAYTLSSPNLIITAPDGTTVTVVPVVSPSSGTSVTPHTFTYFYNASMGGLFSGLFQFLSNTVTISKTILFWVPWNNIYDPIRDLLTTDSFIVPDSKIDLQFNQLYSEFYEMTGQGLPLYSVFSELYKQYFDQGMVYLIASRLRPSIPGKAPTGEVALMKKGVTTTQYLQSQPLRLQTETIEFKWWEQGITIIDGFIPEISAVLNKERYQDELMDRGCLAAGNTHPTGPWRVGAFGSFDNGVTVDLFNLDNFNLGEFNV